MFKPSSDYSKVVFFVDHFCYLCFMFVFDILSCLLPAALYSPAGKGLVCCVFLCFGYFLIWCPWSGVVLDCIDS